MGVHFDIKRVVMFCSVQNIGGLHIPGSHPGVSLAVLPWRWTYTLAIHFRNFARAHQRARSSVVYMPELACFISHRVDLSCHARTA